MAWTRGPTIGRGSTAAVSLATSLSGDLFAVKSSDVASSALLKREECLISRLCSPYVVRCFGSDVTYEDDKLVYNLFLEYLSGGSLSDLIGKMGGSLDEKSIRFNAHQILLGLEYLHDNGVAHCDIKAQNILLGGDGLKIADFGCAKLEKSSGFGAEEAFAGTPAYMAPEVARGEEQSFAADIWALGCTVIEMATGSHPWPGMKDPASALYRIAFSADIPEIPSWFSGEAKDFLSKCLVRDAKKRWTAAQLLRHPFLAAVEEICQETREITRRSPTSVTDQGFWDALEVSEDPTEEESPSFRLGALIGNGDPWCLDFEEDQQWLTVRINHDEECEELIETEPVIVEGGLSPSNSAAVEDSRPDFFAGDITDTCLDSLYLELYSTISVLKIMLMELFVYQDQIFLLFLVIDLFWAPFACFS